MKVYLIHPTPKPTDEEIRLIDAHVADLQMAGHEVHYPLRDVDRERGETAACEQNREAMLRADRVDVAWTGEPRGSLFDLGMAWAQEKPVKLVPGFPVESVPHTCGEALDEARGRSVGGFLREQGSGLAGRSAESVVRAWEAWRRAE